MTATKIFAAHLSGEPVEHPHGIVGEVHEQLFSGCVVLPYGRRGAIRHRGRRNGCSRRMLPAIFLPQQRQCHAATTPLGMDMPPIRR
jgi:hypothetical protein